MDPTGYLLVAIDGTGMGDYLKKAPRTTTGRLRSHVYNFHEDDRDEKKFFDPGPPSTVPEKASVETAIIVNKAYSWLQSNWNPGCPIDMVGHSRGGYAVIRLAWLLNSIGLNGVAPVTVRFMGLYDAVPMVNNIQSPDRLRDGSRPWMTAVVAQPLWGREYTDIPPNVRSTWSVGAEPGMSDHSYEQSRGPNSTFPDAAFSWPRAGITAVNPKGFKRDNIRGTHSALGGAPWDGDTPRGHSEQQDIEASIAADNRIRTAARAAGVDIELIKTYGFKAGNTLMGVSGLR